MVNSYKQWHDKVEIVPIDTIPSPILPKWTQDILSLPEGKAGRIVVGSDPTIAKRLQCSILGSISRGKSSDALNGYNVHAFVREEGNSFAVYFWKVKKEEV